MHSVLSSPANGSSKSANRHFISLTWIQLGDATTLEACHRTVLKVDPLAKVT